MLLREGFRADLLVEGTLIIEVKSVERFAPVHGKQLLTYLRLTKQPLGLLMNFGDANLSRRIEADREQSFQHRILALASESTRGPRRMTKARADQLLVDRGLAESRAKAQALILAGLVFSGERKIDKAGQALADDAPLEVRGKEHPWVSRGGIKLAHALEHFGWDVAGAVALDVGSSTGGFTDVLLQKGRGEGVRGRRRHQPARLEAAPGSAGRRP